MQINDEIRDKQIRVIDADGSQMGIMSADEARSAAYAKNLDLVKIASKIEPPVCKIMDYGKFRFEQAKKEKEARKNQHTITLKEVRMSLVIGNHDFETKINQAVRMLKEGDKVKVSVNFRMREFSRTEVGFDLLKKFAKACEEYAVVEKQPKLEGRCISMFLAVK
ncbi:Translation initiation factor IF-3 [bioreactor metagenome]|uniref:Translation initiation factor IF-3 n=1 Tax=bioreactor metagenome TaxID=1076179 RepID=A0A644YWU8_9ZZZZ